MRKLLVFTLLGMLCLAAGCGGGNPTANTGGNTIATSSATTANVQQLYVDAGPTGSGIPYINGLFTTVTVCSPGTATCQQIDHILVDTGSVGLRVVDSLLTAVTPGPVNIAGSGNGNVLGPGAECVGYGDGSYTWGALGILDVKMAGETAGSAIIQRIGNNAGASAAPGDCTGVANDTVATLGANGILGIGSYLQDCGSTCATASSNPGLQYYSCPSGSCTDTEATTSQQVNNPVSLFGADGNGVIIELPAISNNGAGPTNGSLVFGLATQSNNGISSPIFPNTVAIYPLGFTTQFKGNPYPPPSYFGGPSTTSSNILDTGSNGLYFLDPNDAQGLMNGDSTGMQLCSGGRGNGTFYCPGGNSPGNLSLQTFTSIQNQQESGVFVNVGNFIVANANTLLGTANVAFNDLAGPNSGAFDFGLPFFFGRNVGFAIENKTVNGVSGPGPFYIY